MLPVHESYLHSLESILLSKSYCDPGRNIVGFGFGEKLRNGMPTGLDALRVYVRKKKTRDELRRDDSKPVRPAIPFNKDNISEDDIFDVENKPQVKMLRSDEIWTDIIESPTPVRFQSYKTRYGTLKGGISIGLEAETTGTLGCIVRNAVGTTSRPTREFYILTAGHVLGNYGRASTAFVCQPGAQDYPSLGGASTTFRVAETVQYTPMPFGPPGANRITCDAGIARTIGGKTETLEVKVAECGGAIGTGVGREKAIVKKVGRTTGLTLGRITDLASSFTIPNPANSSEEVILSNQITATAMSREGDSGAILFDEENRIIGLLVAGTEDKSIYSPIDVVLSALNVTLF